MADFDEMKTMLMNELQIQQSGSREHNKGMLQPEDLQFIQETKVLL
jgi:hypothetical protein